MGNIGSRHASNVVDGFVLRLARIVDSVLRTINRKLSVLSSYFFSRVFGYDVVFSDELASPTYAAGAGASTATARRGDPLVCGPGNVCIVPASRIQQRLAEKKRRSERRKRAEAAAMGKEMLQRHKAANRRSEYSKVDSPPSSPITEKEKIIHSLGPVARAPPPRPEIERETAAERDRGKLWVLGNVQPTHTVRPQPKVAFYDTPAPASPIAGAGEASIDEHVIQRMHEQRQAAATVVIKKAIQPRKSSKLPSLATAAGTRIEAVVEKDETCVDGAVFGGHMTTRKSTGGGDRPLLAPRPVRLPDGALSLGPSPWEPSFRHPFAEGDVALTSKAKQQLRQYRPKLSLDTHVETSPLPHATAAFVASPPALDDETADDVADWGAAISRPPSTASTRANRTPALARRSIDAISLRSFDSASNHAHTAIDVKTLATKAVKEEKGRNVWKDQVNKAAMQRCLLQKNGDQGRRFSLGGPGMATATGLDRALTRVRTHELDLPTHKSAGRRGSSPALASLPHSASASGRSTPLLRAESPLHAVSH